MHFVVETWSKSNAVSDPFPFLSSFPPASYMRPGVGSHLCPLRNDTFLLFHVDHYERDQTVFVASSPARSSRLMTLLSCLRSVASFLPCRPASSQIVNTLKACDYEWQLLSPYRVRCRPIRHPPSSGASSCGVSVPSSPRKDGPTADTSEPTGGGGREEGDATTKTTCRGEEQSSVQLLDQQQPAQDQAGCNIVEEDSIILTIQLYKTASSRCIVDVQLFDGPTMGTFSSLLSFVRTLSAAQ